jgi:release factor glutamine methyltransferase
VGTGSGAIALALASELGCSVVATDVSSGALEVARANAERLGLALEVVQGDLLEPLAARAPFALVVANLPYVPTADLAFLQAEARKEPGLALDGGADGLDFLRRLIAEAPAVLAPGGALVLEIGADQGGRASALFSAAGYADVRVDRDLAGLDRVASASIRSVR